MILYPKPAGVTSHDVVARVRRELPRGVKVGHAGTLDPFATGLLLVLVGGATRAQRFLMGAAEDLPCGRAPRRTSTTGDPEGELVETGRVPSLDALPTGEIMQSPPAHSAVKVEGERAYKKARRARTWSCPRARSACTASSCWARDVERAEFEIECSAGTYVRTLVSDLGDAYCEQLERTRIGALALEDADPERLLPLSEALSFMPERALDPARRSGWATARRSRPNGLEGFRD